MGSCLSQPINVQDLSKRLKCMCVCCKGELTIQNSELDGAVKDREDVAGSLLQFET